MSKVHAARPHSSHWGAFSARPAAGGRLDIVPHPEDPDPSPILGNLADAARHRARVSQPAIRRGWLENGPGADGRRGSDAFVPVSWDEAIRLASAELKRVYDEHGPAAVFGGSYGWSSAGRFHHAQSQVHRFLNVLGGYVRSVNTYSAGAANVILPHIVGPYEQVSRRDVSWADIAAETDLVIAFGGMAAKNSSVSSGGASRHTVRQRMLEAHRRGARFVLVSPLRDDLPPELEARWLPVVPGTDVALMLALAHTAVSEGFHDRAFLTSHCAGFERFSAYLLGESDGQPKDARWAAGLTGLDAGTIVELAREMAGKRMLVTVSQSLQRAEFGEQPVWMGLVLAAVMGQVGTRGGGFAYGLGSVANAGKPPLAVPLPTLPQGTNPVKDFIPVARIADMLLNPGQPFQYNGQDLVYPDIRLVYWAGGNPFHHHQDLSRLRRAFARPQTVIVNEIAWTATARHADIVLPTTMTLERQDIGAAAFDPNLIAMHPVLLPYAQARDDYEIFSDMAQALGLRAAFTEGRTQRQWLEHLYETTRGALEAKGCDAPSFDEFWKKGELALPTSAGPGLQQAFRAQPATAPLPTPSGRIEIYSETIARFGYDDCPAHPAWLQPVDGVGSEAARTYPLHLIANQPSTRLHSQLDFAAHSQSRKMEGREPMRMNPRDAAARGLADGAVVEVFNDRGSFLAGLAVSADIAPGVVQIATGAWFDPQETADGAPLRCVHGNPNAVTRDFGTSRLAQGCTGQRTMVDVRPWAGEAPPVRAFDPPAGFEGPPAMRER